MPSNGLQLPALRRGSFPGLRGKKGESVEEEDGFCGEEGITESKIRNPLSLYKLAADLRAKVEKGQDRQCERSYNLVSLLANWGLHSQHPNLKGP